MERVAFETSRLDDLVAMWRASFEAGVGIRDGHPIDEQKQYFLDQVLPHHEVRIAHGFEPTWQLDDVKYLWTAGTGEIR